MKKIFPLRVPKKVFNTCVLVDGFITNSKTKDRIKTIGYGEAHMELLTEEEERPYRLVLKLDDWIVSLSISGIEHFQEMVNMAANSAPPIRRG
ncbi:MAG: hypothetical protein FWC38_00435 [Proteobacteria bacterium]|nr:hypothetical protein [Pseudomonadota bacterium]MCL2306709.1 hypothetical protein [Pseudomonadota bacterium]